MTNKTNFEFDVDFDTQKTVMFQLGRMPLGKWDGVLRFFLAPDGVHISVPTSCKKFVHEYSDTETQFVISDSQ